jgi:hypothetical protein
LNPLLFYQPFRIVGEQIRHGTHFEFQLASQELGERERRNGFDKNDGDGQFFG